MRFHAMHLLVPFVVAAATPGPVVGQDAGWPTLRVGVLPADLRLDGTLDEPAWAAAPSIDALTMTEPTEGGSLVGRTTVWVLASPTAIVIGILCEDPDPSGIVSYSRSRDAELRSEDHVKILFDTFLDGRSGYIFAVNPGGARYDALVARQGDGESSEWDAAWEAATARGPDGWSAEIRIPIQSLSFRPDQDEWGFNVERRMERLQEVSRWSSPTRDAKISQSSRAGRLTGLPPLSFGLGLTVRPAAVAGVEHAAPNASLDETADPSLDIRQRLGANVLVSGTINTDFAETDVDTRQTNLTRFPEFFPEKRTFFLEGSDIFDFGLGLQQFRQADLVPFFSRNIGLLEETVVPIRAGGKVNGRVGRTNFGAFTVRTGERDGLVPASTMGAVRVRQNVLDESVIGILATVGDPQGRANSWTVGTDFVFQTSRLGGDKNFVVGVWGMVTDREGLVGDRTAVGWRIDYPNDRWEASLTYKRFGDGFDPSLSFVPRAGVQKWSAELNYSVRPTWPLVREMTHELRPTLVLDLRGRWESYRLFTAPLNWRFESGDRLEFNVVPQGERLVEPFEITDAVTIPVGDYRWVRFRLEGDIANKRLISGRISWWFGPFYDGSLHQLTVRANIKPSELASLEISGERNAGNLLDGSFTQDLVSARLLLNVSPDLQLSSFVQFDTESRLLGSNTRLRWTFDPLGDLFVVYNHNVAELTDRWALDSNQLLVKLQYAVRL